MAKFLSNLSDEQLDLAIKVVVILLVVAIVATGAYLFYAWTGTSTRSPLDRQIEQTEKTVKNSPSSANARVVLGELYLQKGETADAIKQFKAALKLDKEHQRAVFDLGLAYWEDKDNKKAIAQFKKVIKLAEGKEFAGMNPNLERAYYSLGEIYREAKEYKKAIENYKKSLVINKTASDTQVHLAEAYIGIKKYDEAVEACTEATKYDPAYPDAHYTLGLAYEKKGDKEKALKEYEKTVELNADHADAKRGIDRLK